MTQLSTVIIVRRIAKMNILIAFIGLSCGVITAGGIFGLITKLRLITRFADATKTTKHLIHYENSILWGATLGNIIYLFPISLDLPFANVIFIIFAIFTGIFVGCLATALAETLNVMSVFSRRARLHSHLGLIILCVAIGKFIGSLLFFQIEM